MRDRVYVSHRLLRIACVAVAGAGCAGNLVTAVGYPLTFPILGIAAPKDPHLFVVTSLFAFTLGLVALVALLRRRAASLLALAILGNVLFAAPTFVLCAVGRADPFYYSPVAWSVLEIHLFFLFWIQAKGEALFALQLDVFEGIDVPARSGSTRALLLGVTVEGKSALDGVGAGLKRRGYDVDVVEIGAEPLVLPERQDWDLVVVVSPDDRLAAPARVEEILRAAAYREVFQGRDAAVIVTSRGAARRTMAAIALRLERAGANVVAARAIADATLPSARTELESLGVSLADRAHTRPHWTLLLRGLRSAPAEDRHA